MFAQKDGAVAAPTAALHFTPDLINGLEEAGIAREFLTLHVGAGTFLPVKAEDTADHAMHAEWGTITPEAAESLNAARARGGRVIAVGTTSLRLLESAWAGWHHPPLQRRHQHLHHARLSFSRDRRADDQFPLAPLHAVHAGERADGAGEDASCVWPCHCQRLSFLFLRRFQPVAAGE
jgi:hypothetical protein